MIGNPDVDWPRRREASTPESPVEAPACETCPAGGCELRNKGLEGMCEGERRRLIVPWNMAHGAKGTKGVPPYSDVQYDLELVELSNPRVAKNARKDDL